MNLFNSPLTQFPHVPILHYDAKLGVAGIPRYLPLAKT
ncbi:hypothetical protein Pla144_22610 [Bythopirellula polymerisocia]|uniref:Uncharacterized protein n=1 Tax=Bythopirellula polymerisocia TaxID=2528003 RepID=A0A5C6CVE9_9BACT|nr:hypothetical protein Pla144_22610 [Bythopirellula polymerisocia]